MNLEAMRTSFNRRSAGLGQTISDGDRDDYLNHAYQYTIPDLLPGQLTDGTWELTTIASPQTPSYAFDGSIYALRSGARIGNDHLDEFRREPIFWSYYDPESTQIGKPIAVLIYGRQVTFHPIPDDEYTVIFPARLYPSSTLTNDGIAYYGHANAVVWAALHEFAADYNLPGLEARAHANLGDQVERILGREAVRPTREVPRPTF